MIIFFSRPSYCYRWTFPRQANLLFFFFLSGCRPEPERFQELAAYGLRGRRNLMILLLFFFLDIVTPWYHWVILDPCGATWHHGLLYVIITTPYITLWYDALFCRFMGGINTNDYNAFRRIHTLQDENLIHRNSLKCLSKVRRPADERSPTAKTQWLRRLVCRR